MRRVAQHDAAQVGGGRSAVHGAPVLGAGQQRQAPRVVDVRVGEQHRVEGGEVDGRQAAVAHLGDRTALIEPEIDENPRPLRLEQVARARHLPCRAVKAELHAALRGDTGAFVFVIAASSSFAASKFHAGTGEPDGSEARGRVFSRG